MTANPRARHLGHAAPPRLTSVSGARPIQPSLSIEVDDTWLDVDDIVQLESRPAPAPSPVPAAAEHALELEQLLHDQQLELERLRQETARRIELVERERDAALAEVELLRASLRPLSGEALGTSVASLSPALPPPLPLPVSVRLEQHTHEGASSQAPPRAPEASGASKQREPGSMPMLSEVLVTADLPLGHDPGAADGDDRRSEPRIQRQFELEFNYETHFFAGLSLDISSGGLFIATYHLFPVGTALSLSFQLPDGIRLSVRGEVRWVRCASEGHERPGMGVAFKELGPEALGAIADFCAERPPLYMEL